MSSHLFSPLLTSSELFSHLLSLSQLLSACLSSSQLFSAHSQIISALLWPMTCSKSGSRCQSKQPLHFAQRRFETGKLLQTASFCTEKFVHTQKLLHRVRESLFTASFYTKQDSAHSKLVPREYFTHRSFHTHTQQTLTHTHTEAFTNRRRI